MSNANKGLNIDIPKAELSCKNYAKYLGIWKPRCSCLACRDKFIDILLERERKPDVKRS